MRKEMDPSMYPGCHISNAAITVILQSHGHGHGTTCNQHGRPNYLSNQPAEMLAIASKSPAQPLFSGRAHNVMLAPKRKSLNEMCGGGLQEIDTLHRRVHPILLQLEKLRGLANGSMPQQQHDSLQALVLKLRREFQRLLR